MLIRLDFKSTTPIYMQLCNQIILGIGQGILKPGEPLPTVRQLAEDAGINMMTANKAYAFLKRDGYISIDRRHGATINPIAHAPDKTKSKVIESELSLIISKAGIHGYSSADFIGLCNEIFANMNGLKPLAE